MNLIIDIGNNSVKTAVVNQHRILGSFRYNYASMPDILLLKKEFPEIDKVILSSVTGIDKKFITRLKSGFRYFCMLDHTTDLPITNNYRSKETLGYDRIAAVVGAVHLFPGNYVMVIDAGTAITFDFINEKMEYTGGSISPGLAMRFRALNSFTGKLPLVKENSDFELTGNTTEKSIISGVQNGIVFEIEKYIETIVAQHPDCRIILTGGDALFFEKILKKHIFVEPNLIFYGLNKILEHNIENSKT